MCQRLAGLLALALVLFPALLSATPEEAFDAPGIPETLVYTDAHPQVLSRTVPELAGVVDVPEQAIRRTLFQRWLNAKEPPQPQAPQAGSRHRQPSSHHQDIVMSSFDMEQQQAGPSLTVPRRRMERTDGHHSASSEMRSSRRLKALTHTLEIDTITDTSAYPVRTVARILATKQGVDFRCSGWMASNTIVMTSASCIIDDNGQLASSVYIFVGASDNIPESTEAYRVDDLPYGSAKAAFLWWDSQYKEHPTTDNDWAFLRCSWPVGKRSGWMGRWSDRDLDTGDRVTHLGYPEHRPLSASSASIIQNRNLVRSTAHIRGESRDTWTVSGRTCRDQGAPLVQFSGNSQWVVGTYSGGTSCSSATTTSVYAKYTAGRRDTLSSIINAEPHQEDRPELVLHTLPPYEDIFTYPQTSACPGENVTFGACVRNVGFRDTGDVTVKYFLSTDPVLGHGDVELSSVVLSNIADGKFGGTTETFVLPNVAPGRYYLGIRWYSHNQEYHGKDEDNSAALPFEVESCNVYDWVVGTPGVCQTNCRRTSSVHCADNNGRVVSQNFCNPATKPDAVEECSDGLCAYDWQSTGYDTCTTQCLKYRSIVCVRADGASVSQSLCDPATAPSTTASCSEGEGQCSYHWVPGHYQQCTSSCTKHRNVICVRGDGVPANSNRCSGSPPATTAPCEQGEGQCFYSWHPGPYGVCGAQCKRTRTVDCVRQDGWIVDDSDCDHIPKPYTEVDCNSGEGACTIDWQTGPYGPCSSTCTKVRSVACVRGDGQQQHESACDPGTRPDASAVCLDGEQACDYVWSPGPFGVCDDTCTKHRELVCRRADGNQELDSRCDAADRPSPTADCSNREGNCAYDWTTPPFGHCGPDCRKSRVPQCHRGDGSRALDSLCDPQSKPSSSAHCATGEDQCQYQWVAGGYQQCSASCSKTRSVTCKRGDGAFADPSRCDPDTKPDSDAHCTSGEGYCEHRWFAGSYEQCGLDCFKHRDVECRRGDGAPVNSVLCVSGSKPDTQASCAAGEGQCQYQWDADNFDQCGQSCIRSRSVVCRRGDSEPVSEQLCSGQVRPHDLEICLDGQGQCTYHWEATEFGACEADCTKSRTVRCRRSNGAVVSAAFCSPATRPSSTATTCSDGQDQCTYHLQYGPPSPCGSQCVSIRPIEACVRGDGQAVPLVFCDTSGGPIVTECSAGEGQCQYSWAPQPYRPCELDCTKHRAVICQRGDLNTVPDDRCDGTTRPTSSSTCISGEGQCINQWVSGPYTSCSAACLKSRAVTCVRGNGAPALDWECDAGSRPDTTAPCFEGEQACDYAWNAGTFHPCNTTCTKTRTPICQRSDGTEVEDSFCDAAERPSVTSGCTAGEDDCSYSWVDTPFEPCNTACQRTRTPECYRADGALVDGSLCPAGDKPTTVEHCNAGEGECQYVWSTGPYGLCTATCTKTRPVTCRRADGHPANPSQCDTDTRPSATSSCSGGEDYCEFVWYSGPYRQCGLDCNKHRSVECRRGDGEPVDETLCVPGTRPSTSTGCNPGEGQCLYQWDSEDFTPCGLSCIRTRNVVCRRGDGRPVNEQLCSGLVRPHELEICLDGQDECTYQWEAGDFEDCVADCSKTRPVLCRRGDGQQVSTAFCPRSTRPSDTGRCSSGEGLCSYQLQHGPFGPCNTQCIKTRAIQSCIRGDGQQVELPLCDLSGGPIQEECQNQEGQCSYHWAPRPYEPCGLDCTKQREVVCRRADFVRVEDALCNANARPSASGDCIHREGQCVIHWITGPYDSCSPSCTKSRDVTCVRGDGQELPDAACDAGSRPDSTTVCSSGEQACDYVWAAEPFGACDSSCSKQRGVVCRRSDGEQATEDLCNAADKPASTADCSSGQGQCFYGWSSPPYGRCDTSCTKTRAPQCFRSDGQRVGDNLCDAGSRPATSAECTPGENDCQYDWSVGAYDQCSRSCFKSRPVGCRRADGQVANDMLCDPNTRPADSSRCSSGEGACEYVWFAGQYDTCGVDCNKHREVECRRGDGDRVSNGFCNALPRPSSTGGCNAGEALCSYQWDAGAYQQCELDCTRSRTPVCRRGDGFIVGEHLCDGQVKPQSSQKCAAGQGQCTYRWTRGTFGICRPDCTKTRDVECRRGDNEVVDDVLCDELKPTDSTECSDGEGQCGYAWLPSPWTPCSSACIRTRTLVCTVTATQEVVDASQCGNVPVPPTIEACSDGTDRCMYNTWQTGPYSSCTSSCRKTRVVVCGSPSGDIVDDMACAADRKPSTYAVCSDGEDQCFYGWDGNFGPCSTKCVKKRHLRCLRGDGSPVAEEFCLDPRPTDTDTCHVGEGACGSSFTSYLKMSVKLDQELPCGMQLTEYKDRVRDGVSHLLDVEPRDVRMVFEVRELDAEGHELLRHQRERAGHHTEEKVSRHAHGHGRSV